MIGDVYAYPYPDFVLNTPNIAQVLAEVTEALKQFIKAASVLAAALPQSDSWHVLSEMMHSRVPPESQEPLQNYLNFAQNAAKLLAAGPVLMLDKPRGTPVKHLQLRSWVGVLCWYSEVQEMRAIQVSNDDDIPKSWLARLIRVTLQAMDVPYSDAALLNELRHFKHQHLTEKNFWDLIPDWPPRPST